MTPDEVVHLPTPLGPVLLIGAGGMLGRAWQERLTLQGIPFQAPRHDQLDITSAEHVDRFIGHANMTVINCAAWTDVDGAEAHPQEALAMNAHGPSLLAKRCKAVGACLVHYSTDYVFNGLSHAPYLTNHPRQPIGVYGQTKAQGEEAIEASGCQHLIIRTSWLYAPWGRNFVRTITQLGRTRPTLQVVSDQLGRPTSAIHLAKASLKLLGHRARGIYHVTDQGQCSWYDFAQAIIRLAGSSCQVSPCTTDQFPRPAKRPAYSVLDLSQTEKLIGQLNSWPQNLAYTMPLLEPFA